MSKLIGLVDPNPINHFPSELGDNMEQVVNHASVRAMMLNFQIHGGMGMTRQRGDKREEIKEEKVQKGKNKVKRKQREKKQKGRNKKRKKKDG